MRLLVLGLAVLGISGCAGMVTGFDGERVTIEHDMFVSVESARAVAAQACKQGGKSDAVLIATANKNPRLNVGQGVQLSTFRCTVA